MNTYPSEKRTLCVLLIILWIGQTQSILSEESKLKPPISCKLLKVERYAQTSSANWFMKLVGGEPGFRIPVNRVKEGDFAPGPQTCRIERKNSSGEWIHTTGVIGSFFIPKGRIELKGSEPIEIFTRIHRQEFDPEAEYRLRISGFVFENGKELPHIVYVDVDTSGAKEMGIRRSLEKSSKSPTPQKKGNNKPRE